VGLIEGLLGKVVLGRSKDSTLIVLGLTFRNWRLAVRTIFEWEILLFSEIFIRSDPSWEVWLEWKDAGA